MTLEQHFLQQQRKHPQATGDFTGLLTQLAVAAKIVTSAVRRAGLVNVLGATNGTNVHGEVQQKLDVMANDLIYRTLRGGGHLCVMASEECDDVLTVPDGYPWGKYVLNYDPLDGSSNIDYNVSIGTIFSVHRRVTRRGKGDASDCLQKGREQVCAGYVVYGSSTMFVYTTGQGVFGFTLDPTIGEFVLSHENIQTPSRGKTYSINEGNRHRWSAAVRDYIDYLQQEDKATGRPYSARYIGSLVADFHRNLLSGGIFLYPADSKNPQGKLRLLYEAAPLAFIAQQAGGYASTGWENVLDIQPTGLHERTPLIIGSTEDVRTAEQFIQQNKKIPRPPA